LFPSKQPLVGGSLANHDSRRKAGDVAVVPPELPNLLDNFGHDFNEWLLTWLDQYGFTRDK